MNDPTPPAAPATVMFIDLTGSTGTYGTLGDAQAASVISRITQWIGRVCEAHGGRVVKFLGDGVLARFGGGPQAVEAAVFMQRSHTERMQKWPMPLRMGLKIGIASGPVVEMEADAYGDAINCASRLSDMAGAHEIWADESVMAPLRAARPGAGMGADAAGTDTGAGEGRALDNVRYQALGAIRLRGIAQTRTVTRVDWNTDESTGALTIRGELDAEAAAAPHRPARIALARLDIGKTLTASELPLVIGRLPGAGFTVNDQRVSRQHARIDWQDGAFVLTDLSSFGTWVRFTESRGPDVHLRRSPCILHSSGEIALGAPFTDFTAPVVAFDVRADGATDTPPAFMRSLMDAAVGQ